MSAPLNIALSAFTDQAFSEYLECRTNGQPTDFSAWTGLELIIGNPGMTAADIIGTVTPSAGRLDLTIDQAQLQAKLPDNSTANTRLFQYVLRGRPTDTYRVRLMYGQFRLVKGLPEATAP